MKSVKKVKKLSLIKLDRNELNKREQLKLHGGDCCCQVCISTYNPLAEQPYQYKSCETKLE